MKYFLLPIALVIPVLLQARSQGISDSTGLAGDNFSLQGALALFKGAKDMAGFEKALNDPESKVNNLDLNGDGNVDYLRVIDHVDGDAHAIVLQVPLGKDDAQDVAVIELERTGKNAAQAIIKGDEALFGPDVQLEPVDQQDKVDKGRSGPSAPLVETAVVVVNVWAWPCVRFVYAPAYTVWVSPWYWGYYPRWYRPWHPRPYRVWYGYNIRYQPFYRPYRGPGFRQADVVYVAHRRSSPTVVQRGPRDGMTAPQAAPSQTRPADRNGAQQEQKARPSSKSQVKSDRKARRETKRAARSSRKRGGR